MDPTRETVQVDTRDGGMAVAVSVPAGTGPWPGVVVVHDAIGMSADLRRQADWLATQGYLVAAPDLYHRGGRIRCMFGVIRDALRREGPAFDDLEATRGWLATDPRSTGKVGVIGFCMGGGFAVLLAANPGYAAASVNYGAVPDDAMDLLARSCPIVASYGGRDKALREAPRRLEAALDAAGAAYDIKVYARAGHSFMNDHDDDDVPAWAAVAGRFSESEFHEPSAQDARRRIAAFFDAHLR